MILQLVEVLEWLGRSRRYKSISPRATKGLEWPLALVRWVLKRTDFDCRFLWTPVPRVHSAFRTRKFRRGGSSRLL